MAICFVVGTEIESAFEVKGQTEMSFSNLREKIYEKNENDFKGKAFDANKLYLWKVNIPGDVENDKLKTLKTLESRSHDINDENTIIQKLGGEKLTPFKDLGDIFAYGNSKNIRIIVQPPPPATTASTFITGPSGLVHLFVDNSNLYVQGKKNIARLENLSSVDDEGLPSFDELRIDYGRLLKTILDNRKVGGRPYLVGSHPPSYDSLWEFVEKNGFEVKVFNRNPENHDKEVDTEITRAITKTVITNGPGTLILISGDKNLCPGIKEALENNWKVEIWFWPKDIHVHSSLNFVQKSRNSCIQSLLSMGIAVDLIKNTSFRFLKDYYKCFSYGYGPDFTNTMRFIDISNGYIFDNHEVINWFVKIDLFCWFNRKNKNLRLYFKSNQDLFKAKNWINKNHKEVQFRDLKITRRCDFGE
ncbi:uncharacterized protein OCT59_027501 [Rhizophagus irregularis]|uniref:uncharacterized protein n=1 Tax=Rhizophagus irregularis TaxID=588596 RepID=UPI000CC05A83|nr:hypothetical protein OCT59_027501 [Rhizophagus irregularis]GBC44918.1 NYN domain-containing protein [Rhizophagus irregularis DAOM 181602=DAOM 197198]